MRTAGGNVATDAYIHPYGLVFDSKGNLYFDDSYHQVIFKVDRAGVPTVFAGTLYSSSSKDGALGVGSLPFSDYPGLAIDESDNLHVGGQGMVRKVSPAGIISTPQLAWGKPGVSALAFANGTLFGYTAQAIVQTPVP